MEGELGSTIRSLNERIPPLPASTWAGPRTTTIAAAAVEVTEVEDAAAVTEDEADIEVEEGVVTTKTEVTTEAMIEATKDTTEATTAAMTTTAVTTTGVTAIPRGETTTEDLPPLTTEALPQGTTKDVLGLEVIPRATGTLIIKSR